MCRAVTASISWTRRSRRGSRSGSPPPGPPTTAGLAPRPAFAREDDEEERAARAACIAVVRVRQALYESQKPSGAS